MDQVTKNRMINIYSKEYYKLFLLSIAIILACSPSCTLRKNFILRTSNSKIEIRLLKDDNFESLIYENYLDTIIMEYSKGIYSKLDNRTLILNSDTINNLGLHGTLVESISERHTDKLHLICNTNFKLFDDKFWTYLYLDDLELKFKGVQIDTLISFKRINKARIEIHIDSQYINTLPKLSFDKVVTSEFYIAESKNNVLLFKVPISFETFYYKPYKNLFIKDLGSKYQIINSQKVFRKVKLFK